MYSFQMSSNNVWTCALGVADQVPTLITERVGGGKIVQCCGNSDCVREAAAVAAACYTSDPLLRSV